MRPRYLWIGIVLLAAACTVKENPAHTKIYTPTGVYDYHCPPGQAKKGNCWKP